MCCKWCQRMHRGKVGRERYFELDEERKSMIIQAKWRAYHISKKYKILKKSAVMIQCAFRSKVAKRKIKSLRHTVRDLSSTANERDKLREENRKLMKSITSAQSRAQKAETAAKDSIPKSVLEAMERELISLQSKLDKSHADTIEHKNRADGATLKLTVMEVSVGKMQKENEAMTSQLNGLQQTCNIKEQNNEELLDELNIMKKEMKLTLEQNAEYVEREDEEIATIEATIDEQKNLKGALDTANKDLKKSLETISKLEKDMDSFKSNVNDDEKAQTNEILQTSLDTANEELMNEKAESKKLKS